MMKDRLRILIISPFFPPLNSIASLRPYSWAKYWGLEGHDVTVLTTQKEIDREIGLDLTLSHFQVREIPYCPWLNSIKRTYLASKALPKNSDKSSWHQPIKNACYGLMNSIRDKKGIFHSCRMPDLTHFWIKPALRAIQNESSWDLAISSAGPYTAHLVGAAIKKRGQTKKWIADYRDPWSNSPVYPGLFPFNFIEKRIESKLLRMADILTTVSHPLAEDYASKYPETKVLVIENGFDPNDLKDLDPRPIFPSDSKYRMVHTGNLYLDKRDPSPLLHTIALMAQTDALKPLLNSLEVLFVGQNLANLPQLIDRFEVGRWVKILGFVKRADALRMQRDAHELLFLPWNDKNVDGMMTGKLFEYFYSKTPILAVGSPSFDVAQKLILEAKAGIVCHHEVELILHLTSRLCKPVKHPSAISFDILSRYDRKFLALKLLSAISD